MNRDEALTWVRSKIKKPRLIKHVLAVEAIMLALAEKLNEDKERWGLVGLLHDIDVEKTERKPHKHTLMAERWLKEKRFDSDFIYAIQAHCGQVEPKSPLDWALYAADPTSGLIVAATLMHPTKTLAGMDIPFLMNRFKEKRFAAGASREAMESCRKLGLELEEFFKLSLDALRKISDELGL